MARITFTDRSIRTAAGTVTLGIAAALSLAACGASTQADIGPVSSASASPSISPASTAAAETTAAPEEKAEEPATVKTRVVVSTTRAAAPKPKTAALKYVKIVEPFGKPGRCDESGTTIEMTACVLKKVVDVDYTVDVLQRQRFEYSTSTAERKADLRDDAKWLAQRTKTCAADPTGGSMDQITQAQCLLKVSKARVAGLS